MIKYLGSKRLFVPLIERVVTALPGARSVTDLFSGTSRVGLALKRRGLQVFANDHNAYAHALARCYVEADADDVDADARRLIDELNRLPGSAGYFTQTFCERARFFHPKNGARIDAAREAIARWSLPTKLEAVLLVSLLEAADRVDSTCGVQMAYLKAWAPRAHNDLELRLPTLAARPRHGPCRASRLDAARAVAELPADVLYLDPPYNQHSYLGNYHVWESLVLWDKPPVYGVACKRVDVRERKSAFNSKRTAARALADLVARASAQLIVVSFNDEGYLSRAVLEAMLAERGPVTVIATDARRYVGAQIGIHNGRGERVGEVSHLRNTELLYVVDVARSGVDWASVAASAHV